MYDVAGGAELAGVRAAVAVERDTTRMHVAGWLATISIIWLVLAIVSAAAILGHIIVGKPRIMPVMKWVWPITALYFGPYAIWAYRSMELNPAEGEEPFWRYVFKGVTHCGGGCTLGDIIGEWMVFLFGWTIAGIALWPEFIADFTLAFTLGIVFQYFAIVPMRHLGFKAGVIAAFKADALSLLAFEVGLFAWMALSAVVFFHHDLHPDRPAYWFMMQIGMIIGFATSFPMNWWLIKQGLKEKM